MFLFRSLTTGLVAACFVVVLLSRPRAPAIEVPPAESAVTPVSIIDVAPGLAESDLPALIHLRPGEWISNVNGHAAAEFADAHNAGIHGKRGEFVDLTVSGQAGERRIIMLLQ